MDFVSVLTFGSLIMLVWACIEVGSNDAANLVNAVFGARVMERHWAVLLAGLFVVLGALFASPVMNTVRAGIFRVEFLDLRGSVCIFTASYLVNTVLLYSYSAYGLPVSTTATLVFALAGGALGVSFNFDSVSWSTLLMVLSGIFVSIALSALSAFSIQRLFRHVLRLDQLKFHKSWVAALMLSSLVWFMLKNENLPLISPLTQLVIGRVGSLGFFLILFFSLFVLVFSFLLSSRGWGERYLFHGTSILGMLCMAFAFGQNDLANCASPGLANWMIWKHGLHSGVSDPIPLWSLFACGLLMSLGMQTRRAQRVTRAEVNTASQHSKVNLYAPKFCINLAGYLLNLRWFRRDGKTKSQDLRDERGKKIHYDPLRASVILSVSACVIAAASVLGLPVSTTYVNFAAVISTGWGDRVFDESRADLKMGRAIWVLISWISAGVLALLASAGISLLIYRGSYAGLILAVALNLGLRWFFSKQADAHEQRYHKKKKKRKKVQ